jgi:predicted dehydrogenase
VAPRPPQAAAAGKAVLVEKPTASSTEELAAIISACAAANVQFMDGTMFSHHARTPAFLAAVDALGGGRATRVTSGFSFLADDEWLRTNIRTKKPLEPFGSLGDLGWYNIRFALHVWRGALPTHVRARAVAWGPGGSEGGVPIDVVATLCFGAGERDPLMTFDCAFTSPFRQWVEVSTPGGVARMEDFVISASHAACAFSTVKGPGLDALHSNVIGDTTVTEIRGCNQEAAMLRAFSAAVVSGAPDPAWPRLSLATQAVLDACMESIRAGGADVAVKPPPVVV